ncbi:hypothetical protein [Rickettsia gravesii]|uniref:hypothetical protein n=1 Tax=Rickettsia gravesii TaxID=354585 RepID=UPI00037CBCB2|nr:hypothetical protein [Rickettsia gravesii]
MLIGYFVQKRQTDTLPNKAGKNTLYGLKDFSFSFIELPEFPIDNIEVKDHYRQMV